MVEMKWNYFILNEAAMRQEKEKSFYFKKSNRKKRKTN